MGGAVVSDCMVVRFTSYLCNQTADHCWSLIPAHGELYRIQLIVILKFDHELWSMVPHLYPPTKLTTILLKYGLCVFDIDLRIECNRLSLNFPWNGFVGLKWDCISKEREKRDYVFHYIKKGKQTIDMFLIHQTKPFHGKLTQNANL